MPSKPENGTNPIFPEILSEPSPYCRCAEREEEEEKKKEEEEEKRRKKNRAKRRRKTEKEEEVLEEGEGIDGRKVVFFKFNF